jgi:hypothetical protein
MKHQSIPQFESFRALVAQAESIQSELSTIEVATTQLDEVKRRMAACLDESEARHLLDELRKAEEVVLIKEIRGKRLTADLEAVITEAGQARRAALSEANALIYNVPNEVAAEFKFLLDTCKHQNGRLSNSRSPEDVTKTLTPMVLCTHLDNMRRSASSGSYQDQDPLSRKLDILKQSLARLEAVHTSREELAVEVARFNAACAAFRKTYAKA